MSIDTASSLLAETPPLQEGERLSLAEFRRRYENMPHVKAELIRGVVHMASPVRLENHGDPHFDMAGWLGFYRAFTPGVRGSDNATVCDLDEDTEPQPDLHLRILPECGGQSQPGEDDYLHGPPELTVEVTASIASYDLGDKFDVYRVSGVREYVVWRVLDEAVDWFVLREGRYDRLAPISTGIYQSEVFPGLWLDAEALLRGDLAGVLQVLQQGLASPEHAAFVERLKSTLRS